MWSTPEVREEDERFDMPLSHTSPHIHARARSFIVGELFDPFLTSPFLSVPDTLPKKEEQDWGSLSKTIRR